MTQLEGNKTLQYCLHVFANRLRTTTFKQSTVIISYLQYEEVGQYSRYMHTGVLCKYILVNVMYVRRAVVSGSPALAWKKLMTITKKKTNDKTKQNYITALISGCTSSQPLPVREEKSRLPTRCNPYPARRVGARRPNADRPEANRTLALRAGPTRDESWDDFLRDTNMHARGNGNKNHRDGRIVNACSTAGRFLFMISRQTRTCFCPFSGVSGKGA